MHFKRHWAIDISDCEFLACEVSTPTSENAQFNSSAGLKWWCFWGWFLVVWDVVSTCCSQWALYVSGICGHARTPTDQKEGWYVNILLTILSCCQVSWLHSLCVRRCLLCLQGQLGVGPMAIHLVDFSEFRLPLTKSHLLPKLWGIVNIVWQEFSAVSMWTMCTKADSTLSFVLCRPWQVLVQVCISRGLSLCASPCLK